jgi:hypothetical protein
MSEDLLNCMHEDEDYTWWEYDRHGIELCKVCDKCVKAKLASYGYYSDLDETIEPEPDIG